MIEGPNNEQNDVTITGNNPINQTSQTYQTEQTNQTNQINQINQTNQEKKNNNRLEENALKSQNENINVNKKVDQQESACIIISYAFLDLFYGHALTYYVLPQDFFRKLNPAPYNMLVLNEKKNFKNSIQDIINVDSCLGDALEDPEFSEQIPATKQNYIDFIINHKKYYLKAQVKIFSKLFILLAYLILSFWVFLKEFHCKDEKELKDTNYWECQSKHKCKVNKRIWINILRFIYYIVYYIFYYIYQLVLLYRFDSWKIRQLQRKKKYIIIYKSCEYILLLTIIIIDFKVEPKCYNSKNNSQLYVKINEYKFNVLLPILSIVFQIIN